MYDRLKQAKTAEVDNAKQRRKVSTYKRILTLATSQKKSPQGDSRMTAGLRNVCGPDASYMTTVAA